MANDPRQHAIRLIVFDFGNTIHDFDVDPFFNWLEYKFGLPRYMFWSIFSKQPDGILYAYECGQETVEFIKRFRVKLSKLLKDLGIDGVIMPPYFSDEEFVKNWNAINDPGHLKKDRMRLLRMLKRAGYRLCVLSNTNQANREYVKNEERFQSLFKIIDRFIASCDPDVRCRKSTPDPANHEDCQLIFKKALTIMSEVVGDVRPEETVFVDDVKEYVEVFENMGGCGIHYTGSWTKIEAELHKLGVRW